MGPTENHYVTSYQKSSKSYQLQLHDSLSVGTLNGYRMSLCVYFHMAIHQSLQGRPKKSGFSPKHSFILLQWLLLINQLISQSHMNVIVNGIGQQHCKR